MKDIKVLRKEKGFSQKSFAEALGLAQQTYSSYETGVRKLPVEVAKKIGKLLEMNWWELYED